MMKLQFLGATGTVSGSKYLLQHGSRKILIDCGLFQGYKQLRLRNWSPLTVDPADIDAVILTHAHIDHVFGNWCVKQIYDLPYYLHPDDVVMIDRSETMAALWNLKYTPSPLPTNDLSHGDTITVGESQLQVRFVPGHAPGHVIFVDDIGSQAIVGDTVFRGSIGRTDLPGGNHEQLLQNIEAQIFSLPEQYTLHSGHGPSTTVGYEKAHNPFFQ